MLEFSIPEYILPLRYCDILVFRYVSETNGSIRLVPRVDNFILLRLGKRDGVWHEGAVGRQWAALIKEVGVGVAAWVPPYLKFSSRGHEECSFDLSQRPSVAQLSLHIVIRLYYGLLPNVPHMKDERQRYMDHSTLTFFYL